MQSNGRHSSSCQTGLNPLFLIAPVRNETVRPDVALVAVPLVAGEYMVPEALDDSGRNGDCDHSGIWSDTSTSGSMLDFLTISWPLLSFGRGSCCAEMICKYR